MSGIVKKNTNFFWSAAPLFLLIFIDSMGLGIVFPILNTLIYDTNSHFLAADMSMPGRNFLYGFTIAIFMFCWFFGAAFLGDISDQIGRKKPMMVCLIGAFVGYLLSAFAVVFSSYYLLLFGRIIAGFTSGSQSIAQAAIVDLSEPAHKARNLGLILFFSSLGFLVGPVIGGLLSASSLVPWFNFKLPFYFAAVISLVNVGLLWFLFRETFVQAKKVRIKLHYAIEIFISAFKHEKIRELSIIFSVLIFGWGGYYSFISMYLLRVYHFSSLQNGFYMGLMGIGFGIGTGFLVDPLTKRFSLKQCVIASCLVFSLCTLLTLLAPSVAYVWFYVLFIAIAVSLAYSTALTLFSNQVDADSQGWIMGITGAIMALAFALNGLLVGFIADVSPSAPLIIAIICFMVSAVLMKTIYRGDELSKSHG